MVIIEVYLFSTGVDAKTVSGGSRTSILALFWLPFRLLFGIFDTFGSPWVLKWDTVLERIFDGFPGGTPDPRKSDRGRSNWGSQAQNSYHLCAKS